MGPRKHKEGLAQGRGFWRRARRWPNCFRKLLRDQGRGCLEAELIAAAKSGLGGLQRRGTVCTWETERSEGQPIVGLPTQLPEPHRPGCACPVGVPGQHKPHSHAISRSRLSL